MPIGSVNREGPRRPPWVKEVTTEAPPAWTQRKLRPVESKEAKEVKETKATPPEEEPASKPALKPVLKKQSTVRDKQENGTKEDSPEPRLVKPSQIKQTNKPTVTKTVKVDEGSIDKNPKTNKVDDKNAKFNKLEEKNTKPSVRTIDRSNKSPEKSIKTIERPNLRPVDRSKINKETPEPEKSKLKSVENKRIEKSPEKITKTTKALAKVDSNNKTPEIKEEEKRAEDKMKTVGKPPAPEKTTAKISSRDEVSKKPPLKKQPSGEVKKWRDPLHEKKKESIDKTIANEIPKGHTLTKNESLRSLLKPTPPPPPPPLPPKCPPPPDFKKAEITTEKLKRLEQLKSRPRRRPDWSDMMKEVEEGKKLKHVVSNDRSAPIIARAAVVKNKGQFIFESEKESAHNELLKQINQGIKLKKTKTNDRSKPNLEGLRKFRRQMTIEEQLQKSMSNVNLLNSSSAAPEEAPVEEEEIDEMDDIDKVRDDLQSTKQLLAIELRNKEAQERENKRLQNQIAALKAELDRERAFIRQEQQKTVISVTDAYDDKFVHSLKSEVERVKATADDLEKRYLKAAEERDEAQTELEEVKRKNSELEKKLQQALSQQTMETTHECEEPVSFFVKRQMDYEKECRLLGLEQNSEEAKSLWYKDKNNNQGVAPSVAGSRRSSHAIRQLSLQKDSSFEEEDEESEPEEEESEEKKQKRMEKEVKNMRNKIRHLKEKQDRMKKERQAYKLQLKNQQAALKIEKQKYKTLKREVDKMAKMMKEVGSDEEDEEEEEVEEEEEKESEEEEEETETETEQDTESETESESEPEDAPLPNKKENLNKRVKRHESRVAALKKGNTLLVANVDRLKDDVNKQRDESVTLQKELDSLLEDFA